MSLYYETTVLHLITDIEQVGTQKDIMDRSFQKYIDEDIP